MKFTQIVIPATNVMSLCWCGDALIDWVRGGTIYYLDGKQKESRITWAFPFDAACATKDGRFAVIYQRLGTKALLLREGKILRELNRSFYQAHVYEYPVGIWQTKENSTLIAHCPEDYCRIDIEEAESGVRLTGGIRKPEDFFHSRLMINAAGTRLLSAGWRWHPWDSVVTFAIDEALRNPMHLDHGFSTPTSSNIGLAEESSGCWQTNERLIIGASAEEEDPEEIAAISIGEPRLHSKGIAVYDVVERKFTQSVILNDLPGTIMPIGKDHVVCFYQYPKVISLHSGKTVMQWEDIYSGNQKSSILLNSMSLPPLALDPENHRFAVFGPGGIKVIQVDLTE